METKENQYRVLHNLLENPIFLETIAYWYETLLDSPTNRSYRIMHLGKIRDRRSKPHRPVMQRICEAYRITTERQKGIKDSRDILEIEQELLAPYIPPNS